MSSSRALRIASLATGLLICTAAAPALAANDWHAFDGNLCTSNSTTVGHSTNGVYNFGTSAATVWCPFPQKLPSYFFLGAGIYDRSSTADVTCSVKGTDYIDGSQQTYLTFSSSGGGPTGGYQQIGGYLSGPTTITKALFLECTLPAVQSGAVSHVQLLIAMYQH